MNLLELLSLKKQIISKRQELDSLKEEVELLKLMSKIDKQEISKDLIDIENVYLYKERDSNVVYFVRSLKSSSSFNFKLINIFNENDSITMSDDDYYDAIRQYSKIASLVYIKDAFKEILAYPDNKVPKLLLQKLYYKANKLDLKTLRYSTLEEN